MATVLRLILNLILISGAIHNLTFASQHSLKILNWEGYLSPELVAEFEKKNNVKVELFYFEHDEERDELLATRNGAGFDLVMVDGQSIPGYLRLGWLAPVTVAEVPNMVHLESWWEKYNPEAKSFAMPYGWGGFGIAYRADLVEQPVTSYRQLFTPVKSLQGKIIMSPQALELVPVALKTLGYSMQSDDAQALASAEAMLKSQRPYVYKYESLKLTQESALVTGDAHAGLAYSGDVVALQAFNPNIQYTEAEEGQILWFDYWVVLGSSSQKALAYKFLDFIEQPAINARNVESIYTATFNQEAMQYLSDDLKNNKSVFPEVRESAEHFIEPGPRYVRKIMALWYELNVP